MAYAFLMVILSFCLFFGINLGRYQDTRNKWKKAFFFCAALVNFTGALWTTFNLVTY